MGLQKIPDSPDREDLKEQPVQLTLSTKDLSVSAST